MTEIEMIFLEKALNKSGDNATKAEIFALSAKLFREKQTKLFEDASEIILMISACDNLPIEIEISAKEFCRKLKED